MAGLKEIKIRIKSVKNTKKITYAMKLVSATKMRGAQEAVERSKDYSQSLEDLLRAVLANIDQTEITHPLLDNRSEKKIKVLVIGSNRGLCGGYNSNLNKAVTKLYREKAELDKTSLLIGSKVEDFHRLEEIDFDYQLIEGLGESPADWPLEEYCAEAEREFEKGEIDAFYVVFTKFISALTMQPTAKKLFPLSAEDLQSELEETEGSAELSGQVKFEPDAEAVFADLLPRIVRAQLRQAALDAKASEHASRMTAMDNATKNAGDLIEQLTRKFNRLRQAGITAEILDIVGGANAIK